MLMGLADGTMKECKYWEQVLEPAIWQSLFLIREKYMKKVQQHKEDKKKLTNQQAEREARAKHKDHLQEHIRDLRLCMVNYHLIELRRN